MTSGFELQAIFTQMHQMTQTDLEHKVKSNHICLTTIPNSHILARFALQPAVCEVQPRLPKSQMHWMMSD